MKRTTLRLSATVGVAFVGASLTLVLPILASAPDVHTQSSAVELTTTADAFADLANALDPSASTDGLLGAANSLDSVLDSFGTPTVNVADSLASDFVGFLDLGNEVAKIDSDTNAGFALVDQTLTTINTSLGGVTGDFSSIDTGLDKITQAVYTLDSDLYCDLLCEGQSDTGLVGVLENLFDSYLGKDSYVVGDLNTDTGDLNSIASDLGLGGVIDKDFTGLAVLLADIYANTSP